MITLFFAIALEILAQKSQRDHGLIFASNIQDISTSKTFAYLYLPTIISVIFSMLWAWIDLDVKRLEPYFQLSNADGASAENSLLLAYNLEFLAFVPISAAKRR
jgi:Protein of unknown function (DUF3433)